MCFKSQPLRIDINISCGTLGVSMLRVKLSHFTMFRYLAVSHRVVTVKVLSVACWRWRVLTDVPVCVYCTTLWLWLSQAKLTYACGRPNPWFPSNSLNLLKIFKCKYLFWILVCRTTSNSICTFVFVEENRKIKNIFHFNREISSFICILPLKPDTLAQISVKPYLFTSVLSAECICQKRYLFYQKVKSVYLQALRNVKAMI